jgi:prepilin peptidase CpaA
MSPLMVLVPAMLFPAAVIVAAMRDVTSFTIPNWISFAAILAFFPAAMVAHMPLGALEISAAAGGLALVGGILMFALGWIGGGDAKLFAACALWVGWPAILPFLIWTSLAGGALALALLWSRKLVATMPAMGPPWFGRLMQAGGDVPYGLAIATGALIAFPSSAFFSIPL